MRSDFVEEALSYPPFEVSGPLFVESVWAEIEPFHPGVVVNLSKPFRWEGNLQLI